MEHRAGKWDAASIGRRVSATANVDHVTHRARFYFCQVAAEALIRGSLSGVRDLGIVAERFERCMTEHLLHQAHVTIRRLEEGGRSRVSGNVGRCKALHSRNVSGSVPIRALSAVTALLAPSVVRRLPGRVIPRGRSFRATLIQSAGEASGAASAAGSPRQRRMQPQSGTRCDVSRPSRAPGSLLAERRRD